MRFILALLALLLMAPAGAQPVQQSGLVTPNHLACWATTGAVQDCGGVAANYNASGASTISIGAASTEYCSASGCAASAAIASLVSVIGTLSNLQFAVVTAPGAGQTVTVTLYQGAYGSLVTTALTCQIAGTAKSCSDTTDQVNVNPGNAWALQIVTSAGAASTGGESYSMQFFSQALPPPASPSVLQSGQIISGNLATWVTNGVLGDVGGSSGTFVTGAQNQLAWYPSVNGAYVAGLPTANNGVLATSSLGIPSIISTLPAAVQANITAVGTLASGIWNGTPIGTLYGGLGGNFSASTGALSVLSGTVSAGTLAASNGGSGASTLTAHGVLVGEGTSPFAAVAVPNAQVLFGQTGADPAPAAFSGDFTCTAAGVCSLGAGVDRNVLNTQTANYSIATTDCGKTIQAGTGSTGLFTVTLPSVSGFASNCAVIIKDADTAAGKTLSGFPTDAPAVLWPLQSIGVKIVNGAWSTFYNPGRWRLTANTTWVVNHATGNDTNDGLSQPFATIQHCIDVNLNLIDGNGFIPVCQLVAETFTESAICLGTLVGSLQLYIAGTVSTVLATVDTYVWQVSSGIGITVGDHCLINLSGFKFFATTTGQTGIFTRNFGNVDFGNIDFSTFTSGIHMLVYPSSSMIQTGPYWPTGNMLIHVQNFGGEWAGAFTNVMPNALTIGAAFFQSIRAGANTWINGMTFTGTGSGTGSSGTSCDAEYLGYIAKTGVTGLPGTASTCASGSNGGVIQ